jgi:15-cis-phytoene synthase
MKLWRPPAEAGTPVIVQRVAQRAESPEAQPAVSLRNARQDTRRAVLETSRYDRVAQAAAATVIRDYSSSFGLASHLLSRPVRQHVRNVYAFVRLADEVVDGPQARQTPERAAALLDRLEQDTAEALREGYSTNLVVHAFALSSRVCSIDQQLVAPFFASMRADLTVTHHDEASFARYVYGSSEVVGLMCLRVFLAEGSAAPGATEAQLVDGARRLGAAFQTLNFLRDLAADHEHLGRSYFPGVDPAHLTEADKHQILDDADANLAAAVRVISLLPVGSRRAVAVAAAVFAELSRRLRHTPAEEILVRRIRVPAAVKARIALTTSLRRGPG